jgi:peptidoglycan/LPS O-acetylase OafA/YrhL
MGGGWFGVQIFFVLSGFIVTLPFARHALAGATPPDLKRYLLRRVTRIEPPYILALTAYFLAAGAASGNLSELAGHYAAGLVYSHQYIFETLNPVAQFTWSLEVEVVFYLLAPWLTRIYRIPGNYPRWALQAVLILLTACVAVFRLVPQGPARIENTLVVMIQYFLAGMLLADLYACGLLRRSTQWIWDAAALAGVFGLGAILSGMPGNWRYYWLTPLLIMVLFAGVMRGRFVNRFFRLPAVTIIGGMCYTLYLWHMAAIGLLVYRFKPWLAGMPDWAATVSYCALALPVMVLLCVPIYLLVEKPFMNGAGSRWLEGVMLPYTASRPTSL